MTSELIQLRNELAKINIHETNQLRGIIADLIKDKADRNLLNICLNAGVLQDFFLETTHDTFFISRCKRRLVEEFFINDHAAEKAISFCLFLILDEKLDDLPELIPYRNGDKWGYCNFEKQILVSCKYDYVELFKDEMAKVKLNGKFGFIDKAGKEIIPCKYDSAWYFREGLASALLNGLWRFIDRTGQEIIIFKYNYADFLQ